VWAVMSDPLGLSVGTTNLVAARVGNQPVTRRSVLTLAQSSAAISGFVERVGDQVPLVTPDGKSYLAEQLLVEALETMVQLGGGPSADLAIAIPGHWGPSTTWAFRSALGNSRTLSQTSEPVRLVSDAVAALTALQANAGITVNGVVALIDFGGSGTSITLADAGSSFEPIDETLRYADFSGDLIDQALLSHVLDSLGGDSDPAGTAAVGSLSRLREECRLAKERLSADTATHLVVELPGHRADVRLTREELQDLIRSPLDGVISALDEMTERNGTAPNGLAALAVVGGGASIPFVTQRLSEHSQLPVVTTPQPALNAAVGAALFAAFGADAQTGTAVAADDPDAPTGAAAAATDATAAAAVFDGPLPDEPGSATFRALAWSQEEAGEEPVPYTGENPYRITDTDLRPSVQYLPATGPIFEEPRRRWHRVAQLAIGLAAVIAIITVGGVAYALTSTTESTKATKESGVEPPKQPEPEPPSPPKQEIPKPPSPPALEPPSVETVTSEAPPPPPPTTTQPPITTTRTTTTTSPTTTTTSPTTTTTTMTTTTTTTTTSTTPSMTTSYIRVPFVPVPVPIQVPNQGPVEQPPQYYQPPAYQPSPFG